MAQTQQAAWIIVPNWPRFQHYSDRDPIWIKLYLELRSRDDWRELTLAERGLLVSIWVEYAASRGVLSTRWLRDRVGQRVYIRQLDALLQAGFLELSASKPLAIRYHAASLEVEDSKESSTQNGRRGRASTRTAARRPKKEQSAEPTPSVCDECGVGAGLHAFDCSIAAAAIAAF